MNTRYKIGDTVKIVAFGYHYPDYIDMAVQMRLTCWKEGAYENEELRKKGTIGIIIAIKPHDRTGESLYGIEIKNQPDLIIGENGIELYKRKYPEVYNIVKFLKGELNAI